MLARTVRFRSEHPAPAKADLARNRDRMRRYRRLPDAPNADASLLSAREQRISRETPAIESRRLTGRHIIHLSNLSVRTILFSGLYS